MLHCETSVAPQTFLAQRSLWFVLGDCFYLPHSSFKPFCFCLRQPPKPTEPPEWLGSRTQAGDGDKTQRVRGTETTEHPGGGLYEGTVGSSPPLPPHSPPPGPGAARYPPTLASPMVYVLPEPVWP